jgi:hypothetical protein
VSAEGDLLQVVLAGGPGRGFADLLDGRQEQPDQNGDDAITTNSSISVNPVLRRNLADITTSNTGP